MIVALVASKETGLEANADKTKYMVMSRDQYSGRSHSVKSDNKGFSYNVGAFRLAGVF